jgi:cell division protein FtsB
MWICVAGYFTYHIFTGARGAISWALLTKEVQSLEMELKSLKEDNAFLENKISLLRNDNLDLDLLEEEAQNILGFSYENDIIVLLPYQDK